MESRREKSLLNIASKLDAITDSEGSVTKLAISIVDDRDEAATRLLCKRLSEFASSDSKQLVQVAAALKNEIVNYYGYFKVREICNNNPNEVDEDEKSLDELLAELDSLVGLEKVKSTVNDLIAYQTVQKMRSKKGYHVAKNTLHMAFTGNPGTGKTTVARIVGRVYKQIGLLSKGHFIEVSRTDLIAGYQGQTALKVKKVIESALGGVLFIDEAYSITGNDHSDSYGRECLTELTKALEDYRDDLVVIVAGYTEPMNNFFESNPGLKSRFNTFIEFDDYSSNELISILNRIADENDYKLSTELMNQLIEYFDEVIQNKNENFANGRLARNIYDDLVSAHARRIVKINEPTDEELILLIPDDFYGSMK